MALEEGAGEASRMSVGGSAWTEVGDDWKSPPSSSSLLEPQPSRKASRGEEVYWINWWAEVGATEEPEVNLTHLFVENLIQAIFVVYWEWVNLAIVSA